MLQNEPPRTNTDVQSTDAPASQRRVTPQELTRALAAIETKKEEAARRQEEEERSVAGTITLGEAVEELGLESTPEEIWAEVQAQHAQALEAGTWEAASYETTPSVPVYGEARLAGSSRKKTVGFVALACALLAAVPALLSSSHSAFSHDAFFRMTAPDAEFYRKLNLSQGPNPQYRILLPSPWGLPASGRPDGSAGQTFYPLNAIPDGCTFYRPQFIDRGISADGFSASCVFEDIGAKTMEPTWMMTRHNGRYYERTWIRRADIARLQQGQALAVYPSASARAPGELSPLTLAVGSHPSDCCGGPARNISQPNYQGSPTAPFLALPAGKKIALDGHAWEDFTAFPQRQYQAPAWDTEPGTFIPDQKIGFRVADFDGSSEVEPLQAVPDGVPIHCSSFTLEQMYPNPFKPAAIPQVLIDARPRLDRPWTVIKFAGHPYLRGWIAGRPDRSLPPERKLTIFSRTDAPEFVNPPVQITVPLETLSQRLTVGGTSPSPDFPGMVGKIVFTHVRLDQHAWDKW